MTRKCCVPGCKSNYSKTGQPYVSTFSFPKTETARKLWLRKIGREDLIVSPSVGVCMKHFLEEDIMRETSAYDDLKNVILTCPLKTPRIKEGSVPSIFPPPDPNDLREERTRKAKKKAVKKIADVVSESIDEPSNETTEEQDEKGKLLGALNLDPTIISSAKSENNAEKETSSETEVKKATLDQVKRVRFNERERRETKKFKNNEKVNVTPSIIRLRLDQSKLTAALNGRLLPNVPKTVPLLPKPPTSEDPDHFFFMSLCSDFKEIQNPKTKAFLKMEFQRMIFNAKYEK